MTHKIRFEPYNFKSTTIENIPVYYNHFDFASCIHIRILLRYGSMHDEAGKEGTSHFLEHVLFDGSSIFENEKATNLFSKTYTFETLNAHTGFFELVLKAKCLPENLKTVCEGMFSMVHSPTLTSESIEHERKIIIQEAWGRFKNEKYIAYSKKRQENRLYEIPDRIRMISPLGWPSTIEAISTEDIQSAHRKYFVKENIELYLAGNIEDAGGIEGIVRICSELFKKIPTGEKSKKPYIPTTISHPKISLFDTTYEEAGLTNEKQSSLNIYKDWARVNKKAGEKNTPEENKHLATLVVTNRTIADLVHEKLRTENSWCYSAGGSMSIGTDSIHFYMGADINPDKVEEATGIIWQILEDIKSGKYEDRFNQARKLIIEDALSRERMTENIIDTVLDDAVVFCEIPTLQQYLDEIGATTFSEAQELVRTYMKRESFFTEILRPGQENRFLKKMKKLIGR